MSKRLPPTAKPPKEGGGGGAEQGTGKTKGEQKATVHTFNDIGPAFKAFLYDKSNVQLDKLFSQLEEKTQLQREHISYGMMGLVAIYLILGSAAQLLCNLIGFGYPAYASVKAIRTEQKDDDTHWLIYWTVFAFYSLFDFFADAVMRVVPLYWIAKALCYFILCFDNTPCSTRCHWCWHFSVLIILRVQRDATGAGTFLFLGFWVKTSLKKVIFLLYLYLPQTYGAQIIYEKYLDPMIARIEKSFRKE